MTTEEPSHQPDGRRVSIALNLVFYLSIFVGSPAVAVAQDLLTWPYRFFGLGFVARVLWTMVLTVGLPLAVAVIAARGRGIEKKVFLVVWVLINGYVIYDSIRAGRQY